MLVQAHDLLRVVDCVAHGCVDEAETGTDRCWRHRDWVPGQALADIAVVERKPQPVSAPAAKCRIDGCENPPREGAPTRGPHANLCEDHRKKTKVSRPEPEHDSSSASEGFEARAQRLVEAGRSLDEARLALVAAQEAVEEAETAWLDATKALSLAREEL